MFKLTYTLDLVHVPFGGGGPALQSTVSGHTPLTFAALPPAIPLVKEGRLRALATELGVADRVAFIGEISPDEVASFLAALDVFDHEPLPAGNPFRDLPNTVLTPHLGFTTVEGLHAFYQPAMENILAFLDAKPVNLMNPEVLKR